MNYTIWPDLVTVNFVSDSEHTKELFNMYTQKLRHVFSRLWRAFPYPQFWSKTVVNFYDMRCKELRDRVDKGEIVLLDMNREQPGLQVAAGLYWPDDMKPPYDHRLDIGVFPDNWDANHPDQGGVSYKSLDKAFRVLLHELGHKWHNVIARYNSPASQFIFEELRKMPRQGHNEAEDFAEKFKAGIGILSGLTEGQYSDNSDPPQDVLKKLCQLIPCSYALVKDTEKILTRNFKLSDAIVYEEYEVKVSMFFWIPWTSITAKKIHSIKFENNLHIR